MEFGRKRVTGYRGRGFGLFERWGVRESERWNDLVLESFVWEVSDRTKGKVYKTEGL